MKKNGAGSPGVERNTQAFLEALAAGGGKPIEQLSSTDARAVLAGAQASVRLDLPKADIAEKTISITGQNVNLTIVRPAGVKDMLPVFMFFHGGGWVLGDFPTHERLVRDLVSSSGAAAIFVNYTPSPEARYPTAILQAYGATKWVAEHGQDINVDGKHLAAAGNSVGGNMAAVVSLMAKDRGTPKIRYQVLLWPVTDANFENASYEQFAEGHFLTRNMMKWSWDNYITDPKQRQDVYASPLQASTERLKGLPHALIQTAEMDVLRDEGEAYARKLDAADVDVTATRYNGMIHDFGLLNAISQIPATRSAMLQASAELKRPSVSAIAERFAEVNGVRLHYRIGGKGSPVVLLHGYTQTGHMWHPIVPSLAQRHTVIVPDLRGAGGSAKPESGYDKKTLAVDIHALTASLGLDRVSVVGHDIGLMVAYAYAAQFPQATERVVLMDAFLPGIGNWKDVWLLRDLWHFHFYGEVPLALVQGRERIYFEHFWNDFAADPKHSVPEADRRIYAQAYAQPGGMRAGFEYFRNFERDARDFAQMGAARLAMPLLVLTGEKASGDFLIEQAKQVASDVRGQVVKGSGHWLMEEAPTAVIPAITDFVS